MFWQPVWANPIHSSYPPPEIMIPVRNLSARENPCLHTLQTGVHNASLYRLNHFRSFGFSPAAAPSILLLRPSFRSSIDAIKYRNASIV